MKCCREWVFIQAHFPNQGQVYLSGEVQVWDDYKGQENGDWNMERESVRCAVMWSNSYNAQCWSEARHFAAAKVNEIQAVDFLKEALSVWI